MSAKNLAIVLAPSLMTSSYSDPASCLEGTKWEHALVNRMIEQCDDLFPPPPSPPTAANSPPDAAAAPPPQQNKRWFRWNRRPTLVTSLVMPAEEKISPTAKKTVTMSPVLLRTPPFTVNTAL